MRLARTIPVWRRDAAAAPPCRSFMLLEVVIGVSLLALGMAVVGAQMRSALFATQDADIMTRALMLAEARLAELDTGLIIPEGEETEEDFGRLFPDFGSRLTMIEAPNVPGMIAVKLELLRHPRPDPDDLFDFDEADVLLTLHTLRAVPVNIDLEMDFGLDADALEELAAIIPVEGFDPRNFSPAMLQQMSIEELVTSLPALMQAFGITAADIARMLPPGMLARLQALQGDLDGQTEGAETETPVRQAGAAAFRGPDGEQRRPRRDRGQRNQP